MLQVDDNDPQFLSIDACFRLCRRAKAGHSCDTNPLIKDSFFLPQSDVDAYVGSTGQDTAHVVQVNHSALKFLFLLCHGMVLVHVLML